MRVLGAAEGCAVGAGGGRGAAGRAGLVSLSAALAELLAAVLADASTADSAALAVDEAVIAALAEGASEPDVAVVGAGRGKIGSSPSQRGLRQMITAIPHATKSSSIAMNAKSFCFGDGPRTRTTRVGVLARRGLSGRSGIRIVSCATPRWGNARGVCGYDGLAGAAFRCGPDGGWPG